MQHYQADLDYETLVEDACNSYSAIVETTKKIKNSKTSEKDPNVTSIKKHKTKKKAHRQELDCSDSEVVQDNFTSIIKSEYNGEINNDLDTAENENVPNNVLDETIDWPQQDFQELVKRIEMILPEKDNLAYGTRVEKLNWDEIAFNSYTPEQCKKAWLFMQKKIRRYRLLVELLRDAKDLLTNSWPNFIQKNKRHPDMPKRPLSSYMLFYMKKKDKILSDNPGIELPEVSKKISLLYKDISESKRAKYMRLAAEERKKYEIKLEEFYRNHPEVARTVTATSAKATEIGPKKPQTPFGLYYEDQLKISKREGDLNSFRESCREQWRNLSDKKKLVFIDRALENELKYQEDLKKFVLENPNFVPTAYKPILNKDEKLLKDRLSGKPKKPPPNAYSLFSQMMMRSEDIKKIDVKDRIKAIAEQWNYCSEEEKKRFKEHSDYLQEKYKLDYMNYLETLPEDKRKQEIENSTLKRKKTSNDDANHISKPPKKKPKLIASSNIDENNAVPKEIAILEEVNGTDSDPKKTDSDLKNNNSDLKKTDKDLKRTDKRTDSEQKKTDSPSKTNGIDLKKNKKKKMAKTIVEQAQNNNANDILKILEAEPPTPPVSAFELFSSRYSGKLPLTVAWKKLHKQQKQDYQTEVALIKEHYIKKYEEFLKSLSKEQLTTYSKLKKACAEQPSGDSSSNNDD